MNVIDGKAKTRDTCATDCKAGTRERPANLFILALPCWCHHASLSFTYVSFLATQTLYHSFLHNHNTCTLHSGQDLSTRNAYRRAIDPTLSLSMLPTTQLRFAPSDDHHLSSLICIHFTYLDKYGIAVCSSFPFIR